MRLTSACRRAAVCAALAGWAALPAAFAGSPGPVAPRPDPALHADELILQFKRPELRAALKDAARDGKARANVQRALDTLAQRHGVALHYVQTLAVGSALVAMSPAAFPPAALDQRVKRLAADADVAAVEINARMTPFRPPPR